MQVPRIVKITLNMGWARRWPTRKHRCGGGGSDPDRGPETGGHAARKAIAISRSARGFHWLHGELRGQPDVNSSRLITMLFHDARLSRRLHPRLRRPRNYASVQEQIIFPRIEYDKLDKIGD